MKNVSGYSPFSFLFYFLKLLSTFKLYQTPWFQVSTLNIQSIKELSIKLTFGKSLIPLYIWFLYTCICRNWALSCVIDSLDRLFNWVMCLIGSLDEQCIFKMLDFHVFLPFFYELQVNKEMHFHIHSKINFP